MDRLTMRTIEGMATQNCYDCKMQKDAICDYQKCRKRIVDRLAYFEDLADERNRTMKVKLDQGAFAPERAHKTDAGLDLRSPISVEVPARGSAVIDTGVHIELPNGTVGFLKSKSGLNVKHDITSEGVIDVGFTGSIKAKLYNHGTKPYQVLRGDKITQLVIFDCRFPDVEIVDELETTERGGNGFGSTGR